MCRAGPEVNRSEVFRGRGHTWSVIPVKSCSLATPAVWPCCTLKRSLNSAGRCWRTAEQEANTQRSHDGTHTHPVESQGKAWTQSQEEVQKCSFPSDHLNYKMLKIDYEFFCPMTPKIKWPTPALNKLYLFFHTVLCIIYLLEMKKRDACMNVHCFCGQCRMFSWI